MCRRAGISLNLRRLSASLYTAIAACRFCNVLVVVLRHILTAALCCIFWHLLCFTCVIILRYLSAACLCIVLRNHFAASFFIVLGNHSAIFFVRHLRHIFAVCLVVVLRNITAIEAVAIVHCFFSRSALSLLLWSWARGFAGIVSSPTLSKCWRDGKTTHKNR